MYSCIKTTTGPLACVILVSNIPCTTPQLLGKMLKSWIMNNENNIIRKKSIVHKIHNGKEESEHSYNTRKYCRIGCKNEINACAALLQDRNLNVCSSWWQLQSFQETDCESRARGSKIHDILVIFLNPPEASYGILVWGQSCALAVFITTVSYRVLGPLLIELTSILSSVSVGTINYIVIPPASCPMNVWIPFRVFWY